MPDEGKIIKPDRPMICEIDLEAEATATVIESSAPTVTGILAKNKPLPVAQGYEAILHSVDLDKCFAFMTGETFIEDILDDTSSLKNGDVRLVISGSGKRKEQRLKQGQKELERKKRTRERKEKELEQKAASGDMKAQKDLVKLREKPLDDEKILEPYRGWSLGISTHKLITKAISVFTEVNHTGKDARIISTKEIAINTRQFAYMCGYDVYEHPTSTPEEALRERKRAENAYKDAKKQINKDLDIFFNATLRWDARSKNRDFLEVRLLEGRGIKAGHIHIKFTETFANFLIRQPLNQYPIALYGMDERNRNAYTLAVILCHRGNMDNNIKRGTANILGIANILPHLSLPSIEEVRAKNQSWTARIKEPFETALDKTISEGILDNWYYSHSKGVRLSDEEADFSNYEEWVETMLYYTLKNAPDHTERLAAREAEKQAALKAAKSTKKDTKNTKKSGK